jgi:hypothetical protein
VAVRDLGLLDRSASFGEDRGVTEFVSPNELAYEVRARWDSLSGQHGEPPDLPDADNLRRILTAAFVASLEREEGRALRFVLCCAPAGGPVKDGLGGTVPVVPLDVPRPLTVAAIRSLAPAVSPANAALLVRFPRNGRDGLADPGCEISGVLHVGENVARSRSGRSFYHRPAPHALTIEVVDAGELHIYQGGIRLVSLKAGHLHNLIAYSTLEFLPISRILTSGEEALRPRVVRPRNEPAPESSDFEWTALLNTILCIVNGVRARNHGGTVLLVEPGAEGSLPVRTRFAVNEQASVLSDRFVDFVNTRHVLADARVDRGGAGRLMTQAQALLHLQNAAFAAEDDLVDVADVVAGLAAVDGALILTADLRTPGFGAEIVLDAAAPVRAYEALGIHAASPSAWPVVDSESFGMRHRSAMRCVGVSDRLAAFVVSQDGQVSLFWKQEGRLFLKRNVNTANPNMIGS